PRRPHREVDERRRPAEDRGAAHLRGAGAVQDASIDRRDRPAGVHVRVDAAGNDQLPRGVDDAPDVPAERARRRNRCDGLALDRHVRDDDLVGRDDLAAANQHVEHRYASPNKSAESFAGSLTYSPSRVSTSSTAFANRAAPPNFWSVSGGMNLKRMFAVPGRMPT